MGTFWGVACTLNFFFQSDKLRDKHLGYVLMFPGHTLDPKTKFGDYPRSGLEIVALPPFILFLMI